MCIWYEKLYYSILIHMKREFKWAPPPLVIVVIIVHFTSVNYTTLEVLTNFHLAGWLLNELRLPYHVLVIPISFFPVYHILWKKKYLSIMERYEGKEEEYKYGFLKYLGATIGIMIIVIVFVLLRLHMK